MKILIVEDDIVQSTMLKMKLSKLGYDDISIADNGLLAKKSLLQNNYDLIFCDIIMPHVDGIELISSCINNSTDSGLIIMSVIDSSIIKVTKGLCHLLGYNYVDTLAKPYTQKDLSKVIEGFTNRIIKIKTEGSKNKEITLDEIQSIFKEDRIFVQYQPQFSFRTGAMIGVEALARMSHEKLGQCTPDSFLSKVRELGLMDELYERVLDKATAAMSLMTSDIRLSVNINQELLETNLCDKTLDICKKNNFPPNNLTLEITETEAYGNSRLVYSNLARLRLHNIGLAIDDFGTGFASVDKLIDLPFTDLKIDRSFIDGIVNDYKLQQVTKLSLHLSQSLGLNCIAEGVEDKQTWDFLKKLGIDACQGFYTGKPVFINDILELASKDNLTLKNSENYDNLSCIVFDSNLVRGFALSKLMKREFSGANIIKAKSNVHVKNLLRDMPINLLVCDENSVENIFSNDEDFKYLGDVVVVCESLELERKNESFRYILRSESMLEIISGIKNKINNKVDYENDVLSDHYEILSKRERDVAKMLLAGFSNKHIAYELNINQKTVSTYKTRILQKLDVRTIIELVKKSSK
ncbi:EAL domain-containing protein [Vibrio parahaemolyticus]|nr:EAL domain-containing protein [Vibrio parahaemolyticus]EJM7149692.1 EAL domain-containing protein [Vibrio parahaemolyticus]